MRASLFKDGVVFFITRLDDTLYWSKSLKIIMIIITIKPPFDFSFQKGVVIVDSGIGIGESELMDEEVVKYLPFAFIYVIKTDNAGGVQKDRVSVRNNHYFQMTTI